jgi:hypothetical protein
VKDPKLKIYVQHAKEAWQNAGMDRVSTHQMLRTFGNDADHTVKYCIAASKNIGEDIENVDISASPQHPIFVKLPKFGDWFPSFVAIPTPSKPNHRRHQLTPGDAVSTGATLVNCPIIFKNVQEFAQLRRFPARSSIPDACIPSFSNLMKTALIDILDAKTDEQREEAVPKLLTLPSMWLPANAATSRIMTHLNANSPFHLDIVDRNEPKQPQDEERTLANVVESKIKNRNIKGAMSMLRTQAVQEQEQMPFETKIEKAQQKFQTTRHSHNGPFLNAKRYHYLQMTL